LQSCVAFGGFHNDVAVTTTDGGVATSYAYAVIPTCSPNANGQTSVVSHEWVEASTDPLLTASGPFTVSGGPQAAFFGPDQDHLVWELFGGGEAGDMCEREANIDITPPDIGYPVQRVWSNVMAMASHDPCNPNPAALPFFDSAPVLNDEVTFTSPLTGTLMTKGIVIPVGQSATIEVDLFSDAATSGPWTVKAIDMLYDLYGSYGFPQTLSFSWDRTQGVNGEKLHLTVTVTSASPIGGGHAFMIESMLGAQDVLWPGFVVEQ
jgi:hypothetical protein